MFTFQSPQRCAASIEPLEARIAPAVVLNPLPDIVAGAGKTGATVDLSHLFDASVQHPERSIVEFTTNFDTDTATPGLQAGVIRLELFDDLAPLTVQNFLSYVENANARGDYDGTFFHRAISGFVLQGGGFETRDFDEHIDVGQEVHNEFNRSNLRGTIAMAKTGLGPNTATSEFFVNLANNSANLDGQNGGFTVFGQVIEGMEIVDAIVALPKRDLGGALGSLPVQGAPGDTVKSGNLVTITDAKLVARPDADTTGTSYQVLSVSNPTLLAATIAGNDLQLQYQAGQSGVTDVTVRVSTNGEFVDETFAVTVKPNLIANIEGDPFQSIVVPGDGGTAKIKLGNNGASTLTGNFKLQIYLSKAGGQDSNGTIFDASDLLVGEVLNAAVIIPGGESSIVESEIQLPQALLNAGGEVYRFIVRVTPVEGTSVDQLFTDDDNAIDGDVHVLTNQFGTFSYDGFGKRTVKTLTYTEADGDIVKLSMKGKGTGRVFIDGDRSDLLLDDTTLRSAVKGSVTGSGKINLDDLQSISSIGKIDLASANATGFLSAAGGVKSIKLGDVTGGATFSLGLYSSANSAKTSLTLGSVQDLNLQSQMPLGKITAQEWLDTGGTKASIIAPSLSSLRITGSETLRGDFEANLTLVRDVRLGSFAVAGALEDSTISVAGNVGNVTLGSMIRSSFFAGVSERPDAITDFAEPRTVDKFTVTGIASVAEVFVDSQVAAARFGKIELLGVTPESGDSEFGFVADAIRSYNRLSGFSSSGLDVPSEVDATGNYSVTVL